jgi:hypothetical protein
MDKVNKLVKESLDGMPSEKILEVKAETLTYLREKIFPKLDYDELVDYLKVMRTWFDSNIY